MKSLSVLFTILLLVFAKMLAVQLKRADALPADQKQVSAGFSSHSDSSNAPVRHVSRPVKKVHYYP